MLHSCTHSSGAGLPLLRRGTRSCCPCAVVHVAMRPAGVLAAVLAAGAALAGWVTLKAVDAAPPEALAQFPLPLAALVQLRSVALGTVAWVSRMGGNDVAAALANANGMMAAPSGTEDRLNASPASRQLFSIFDRFFDNEQTEDQVLSRWAQVIPGTQSQFFKGLVSKPLPRFRHIAVPLPSLMRDHVGVSAVVVHGGWNGGPRSDMWIYQPNVFNASTSLFVSGRADESPNSICDENRQCNRWREATQFVSKPSCNTAVPLIPQCKYSRTSAASSKAKRDAALAPLKRTQHAGALFYRDIGQTASTGLIFVVGGRTADTYVDSSWTYDFNDTTWRPFHTNGQWVQEEDLRLHERSRLFAEARDEAHVQDFPPPRAGATVATAPTTSSSIVTRQEAERTILVDRKMTEGETVNLRIDFVTRLDEVRAANGLSTNTPLADLINGSYFAFPDVSTTDQEVPVISPSLCSALECDKLFWFYSEEEGRIMLEPNVTLEYQLLNTRMGAAFVTTNRTYTGHVQYNITGNNTEHAVQTNTYVRSDMVSDGITRFIMFGGWNGSAYLNDVWEAQHAVQMEDFRWDQDILPEVTMDSPDARPNYEPNIHRTFPLPPLKNTWRVVEPTLANGTAPPGRWGHTGTVFGQSGGLGQDRYSMLIFGGRGDRGYLNDTWEMLLEPYPPPQREVQQIQCDVSFGQARAFVPYLTDDGTRVLGSPTAALRHNSSLLAWARAFEALEQVQTATVHRTDAGRPSDQYQALEIVSWSEAIADAVDNALTNGNMSRWDVALCVTDREDSTAFHTNITLYPPVSAQQTVGGVRAYLPIIFELIGQGDVVSAMPVQSLQVPDFPTYTLFEIASPNGTAPPVRAEHAAAAVRANDDDRLPSVFVYGGWDGVGPMSDTWMFRPGDSPGTGAWEAVSPADGGGKWMYCRQDAHPVELHGYNCENRSKTEAPPRYAHTGVSIVSQVSENGSEAEALMSFFGVGMWRIPKGINENIYGLNGGGGEDPDQLAVCHGNDQFYCAGVVTLDPAARAGLPAVLAVAFAALAAFAASAIA